MRVRIVSLGLLFLASSSSAQDDEFGFEMMEAEVKEADEGRYDAARALLNQERYPEALAAYDELLKDEEAKEFHQDAEYDSAKALYRMGLFHASLERYRAILAQGDKHKYFDKSRDWLFFLARRMQDNYAAVAEIARYAKPADLPPDFKDEFNYQLARFYFETSLRQQSDAATAVSEDPASDNADGMTFDEGAVEGGDAAKDDTPSEDPLDFSVDDIGEPGDADKPAEEGGGEGEEDDEGFDFSTDDLGGADDDGFDFSFGDEDDSKKKKKKRKKRKKRRSKKKSASDKDDEDKGDKSEDAALPGDGAAFSFGEPETEVAPDENAAAAPTPPPAATALSNDETLQRALTHSEQVSDGFALYVKALYLKGLILYAQGKFEPAVDAFQQVVRMTHPENGTVSAPKLREMAFFSLARIHYQFEQFRYAIFYYERIDRDSERWLDALFESSWAHFRLGEYEKSLGNLVTIQSPFFVDEYYPESHILKAITFYENCRYPEAKAFLEEFKEKYDGVIAELDRLASENKTPQELYNELTALKQKVSEGGDDDAQSLAVTAKLVRLALSDRRLNVFTAAIAEVDEELTALQAVPEPFGGSEAHQALVQIVEQRKANLVDGVGSLLKAKLSAERAFLKDLQAKLIRIQFEIAKQVKEGLEAQLSGETQAIPLDELGFTTATDDERVYWPFVGEYWRDELGTYRYTLTKSCRPQEENRVE